LSEERTNSGNHYRAIRSSGCGSARGGMSTLQLTGSLKDLLDSEKPAITASDNGFVARGIDYTLNVWADRTSSPRVEYDDCALKISVTKTDRFLLTYEVKNGYAASQIVVLQESKTHVAAELLKQLQADSRSPAQAKTMSFSDAVKLIGEQIKYQRLICTQ
jgi:hypothetical protein